MCWDRIVTLHSFGGFRLVMGGGRGPDVHEAASARYSVSAASDTIERCRGRTTKDQDGGSLTTVATLTTSRSFEAKCL